MLMLLTACGKNENISENEAVSETSASSAVVTEAVTTKAKKPIKPLSASSDQAYFQNEDFSITAELEVLQSSLYYPDIVAEMGADPELFVAQTCLRVKNMTYDDKSFDCSKLSLLSGGSGLYNFDTECEEAENIPSGKSAVLSVRFLCTLSQAAEISGMTCGGDDFEIKDEFIPEEFAEVIEKQSADDVREYLYRPFVIHRYKDYYSFSDSYYGTKSNPAAIEANIMGKFGENNEYFAVKYMVYNRSDYALLLEPDAFDLCYLPDGADEMVEAEKAYISTDEKLMYEPTEADESLSGIGTLYEIPEFLCMNPEGVTEFTILYKAEGRIKKWMIGYGGSHSEPYYGSYEAVLANECDYE